MLYGLADQKMNKMYLNREKWNRKIFNELYGINYKKMRQAIGIQ